MSVSMNGGTWTSIDKNGVEIAAIVYEEKKSLGQYDYEVFFTPLRKVEEDVIKLQKMSNRVWVYPKDGLKNCSKIDLIVRAAIEENELGLSQSL